jgi:hypothetical protein
LSKHAAHPPKHRKPPQRPLAEAPKKVLKTTVLVSSLAVGGTGAAVATGVVLHSPASAGHGSSEISAGAQAFTRPTATQAPDPDLRAERRAPVSRSLDRESTAPDPAKRAAVEIVAGTGDQTSAVTHTEDIADTDPKSIASALLPSYGWSSDQFSCLDSLWTKESGWRVNAYNPSGAYGIPQALPGSKMASEGSDWQTNPETQIKWGLGYIQDRYGSPCGAWGHSESYNWY